MSYWIARVILWTIAAFYAYGALVHVINILGLSGFSWIDAPAKWRILDLVYLVLDIAVVIGILVRSLIGYVALVVAAVSQIFLYTVFRDWIVDVPKPFTRTPEEIAYLDMLVTFHVVTLFLFCFALWIGRGPTRTI
ncbi:MAG: hypothetical protein AAFO01_09450 [Pseudomonadota bacterium]